MIEEWRDQRCVVCGEWVDALEVEALEEIGLPACCEAHHNDVYQEVHNGNPGWPAEWHGKAVKTSGEKSWYYR